MGGILVDGCGASDSYYKIKDVAQAYCKTCGCERVYALMELKMKIRVFWIPTVSINTKYAVVCPVCKNGYIVDEGQKNDILTGRAEVKVKEDGLILHTLPSQNELHSTGHVINKQPELPADQPRFCFRCGSPLDEKGLCPHCDEVKEVSFHEENDELSQIRKQEIKKVVTGLESLRDPMSPLIRPQSKICPHCQLLYAQDKEYCDICGRTLVQRENHS